MNVVPLLPPPPAEPVRMSSGTPYICLRHATVTELPQSTPADATCALCVDAAAAAAGPDAVAAALPQSPVLPHAAALAPARLLCTEQLAEEERAGRSDGWRAVGARALLSALQTMEPSA